MTFLSMGGYAAFVWPSFAVAAVVLVGLFVVSWRQVRATEGALEAQPRGDRRPGRGDRS